MGNTGRILGHAVIPQALPVAWNIYNQERKLNKGIQRLTPSDASMLNGSIKVATGVSIDNFRTARCIICKHAEPGTTVGFNAPAALKCGDIDGLLCSERNPDQKCRSFIPLSRIGYVVRRAETLIFGT